MALREALNISGITQMYGYIFIGQDTPIRRLSHSQITQLFISQAATKFCVNLLGANADACTVGAPRNKSSTHWEAEDPCWGWWWLYNRGGERKEAKMKYHSRALSPQPRKVISWAAIEVAIESEQTALRGDAQTSRWQKGGMRHGESAASMSANLQEMFYWEKFPGVILQQKSRVGGLTFRLSILRTSLVLN